MQSTYTKDFAGTKVRRPHDQAVAAVDSQLQQVGGRRAVRQLALVEAKVVVPTRVLVGAATCLTFLRVQVDTPLVWRKVEARDLVECQLPAVSVRGSAGGCESEGGEKEHARQRGGDV